MYHRLSVYPLPIPPLRERQEDIPLLAGHFLELNRSRLGMRALRLSASAELGLINYSWPGNIRELEHVISRAAIKALSRGARRSDIVTIEPDLLDIFDGMQNIPDSENYRMEELSHVTLRQGVEQLQKSLIRQAVDKNNGSWSQAARQLDLDPSNLHKLAQRLGLK